MNIEEIKAISTLMSEHGLTEVKIEAEGLSLSMKREKEIQTIAQVATSVAQVAAPVAQAPAESAQVAESDSLENLNTIDSPIVGTFYTAASPDAPAFVKVGDSVSPDTVLCIVEAMKVMNEIKAECSGTIKKVLVNNSEPVEYGQPLFVIE